MLGRRAVAAAAAGVYSDAERDSSPVLVLAEVVATVDDATVLTSEEDGAVDGRR